MPPHGGACMSFCRACESLCEGDVEARGRFAAGCLAFVVGIVLLAAFWPDGSEPAAGSGVWRARDDPWG
eukprot:COSAG04_NODE_60_length_30221_cov_15.908837_5_plen_69_part_00